METTHELSWCEVKLNGKLKECTDTQGQTFSIWRIDTKGVSFPDFDGIAPGSKVTGNLWENPKTGKFTLYPPKPKKTYSAGFSKAPQIEKAMERKEESIKHFQESKQDSMKVFAAYRDATLIVTHFYPAQTATDVIKQAHKEWVKYLLSDIQNTLDMPF